MKWVIVLAACLQIGCGVVIGTVVDTATGAVTYPIKEYVCWGAYKYDNTWDEQYSKIQLEDKDHGDILVGVAVSGGGSRSAYFAACVLEQLSKIPIEPGSQKSYLDEIDYISSVSGGSLASAYYCLKRHTFKNDQEFFQDYKEKMAYHFEMRTAARLVFCGDGFLNFFTYHDRGDSLAAVWDSSLFGDATFSDLLEAEKQGAPTLIINGTNLNDGLKFVFSTLKDSRFQSKFFQNMRQAGFIKHATDQSHIPFRTVGFETINSDIAQYPVSRAVVASASVPNLIGPVTLKDYSQKDRLIHISDGGIYDNYGVESLMQIFTKHLEEHPGKKAIIVVIDGSGYFQEVNEHSDDFSVAYYAERPLSISWLRTKHYMEYVYQLAQKSKDGQTSSPYQNLEFELISLYDVLPSQVNNPYFKNKALQTLVRPDVATLNFLKQVTTIQTRFKISEDDIGKVEDVAKAVTLRLQKLPKEE